MRKGRQNNKLYGKVLKKNNNFVMGHAVLNRLIVLVNKTQKINLFQGSFHFHDLSWVFDRWRPKNGPHWRKRANNWNWNWTIILKPRFRQNKEAHMTDKNCKSQYLPPPNIIFCQTHQLVFLYGKGKKRKLLTFSGLALYPPPPL